MKSFEETECSKLNDINNYSDVKPKLNVVSNTEENVSSSNGSIFEEKFASSFITNNDNTQYGGNTINNNSIYENNYNSDFNTEVFNTNVNTAYQDWKNKK